MKKLLVVLLIGCFVAMAAPASETEAGQKPKGSIVVAITTCGDEPVDPQKSKTQLDRPITDPMGAAPVSGNLEGQLVPGVCSSWRLVPGTENLGWEFKLRKGVRFWDGSPVTVQDVKFSIDRAMDPKTASEGGPFVRNNVDRVEIVDDETLMFYSPKPTPIMPLALAGRYNAVISKARYEKVGDEAFGTVENLMTCGPFKPIEHKKMRHFIMEANEDFYDPDRVPRVKQVKLMIVPELSTRLAMIQTGEADIIDGATGPTIGQIRGNPDLKVSSSKMTATYFLTPCDLNFPEPSPLKDKRVRQALAYAIDVDSIIKKIYFGEATRSVGMMYPRDVGYDPTIKPWEYDPEKAKKLMAEAGYAKGFTLDLQGAYTASTPLSDKVLEAVAGFWKKLGVEAKLNIIESGIYYAKYRDKAYRGFAAFSNPASIDHTTSIWYLATTDMMYSFYSNPDMDKWVADQKVEMDPQKRAGIATNIYRHWFYELVGIPIHHVNTLWATGPKVKSWTPPAYTPYTVGLEYVVPAD